MKTPAMMGNDLCGGETLKGACRLTQWGFQHSPKVPTGSSASIQAHAPVASVNSEMESPQPEHTQQIRAAVTIPLYNCQSWSQRLVEKKRGLSKQPTFIEGKVSVPLTSIQSLVFRYFTCHNPHKQFQSWCHFESLQSWPSS